ncbi:M20/M25/M40 family metallo-hydrolase [Conexibacter arvalis]|uniref:Tripeptide aminopeptidase n=1 Tax=Conexibacter arvalis TaxID=912552 RepID=A0A840IJB2_9ACTN|nr:tripeptide aminopeptidase [Conexibacter arvalis]
MRRADEGERRQLNELFAELCAIESPFGRERACADRVAAELRSLGLEVEEDGAGSLVGSDAGNLFARIPSRDERAGAPAVPGILLCAHLDTVPLTGPVEPVLVDDGWENRHEAILGADNKAALAVMLAVARRAVAEPPPVAIELLFTVCEENALAGAKAFDVARLRSAFGFVFDHATPIGEVIVASPTYHRVVADFRGLAAHAGIEPELGRSAIAAAARAIAAMPLGRIDEETTANVGVISGGSGVNVVPDRCRIEAEARSIDDAKVETTVAEIVDHLHDGANAAECDVDVTVEALFRGYRVRPSSPQLAAAEAALQACGYVPRRIASGGGSDANAFIAAGFPCLNLANGTERAHQVDERVSVAALEGMLDVALALVDESAVVLC